MARVYAYVLFSVALVLMFNLLEMPIGAEGVSDLLGLSDGQVFQSPFWESLFDQTSGIIALAVASGIVIGFLFGGSRENFILIPVIIGPLAVIGGTFVRMITNFNELTYPVWGAAMLTFLFGTLTAGYAFSMVEWFRGNI